MTSRRRRKHVAYNEPTPEQIAAEAALIRQENERKLRGDGRKLNRPEHRKNWEGSDGE